MHVRCLRVELLSACGYDHKSSGSKEHKALFPYTGCLAHVEVLYQSDYQKVLRIRGYVEHNDVCFRAEVANHPRVPIHPEVSEWALKQLEQGATMHTVLQTNLKLYKTPNGYKSQPAEAGLALSRWRWALDPADSRALYRQQQRMQGISTIEPAHVNIHQWLDSASPRAIPELVEAVQHYAARQAKDDRFELVISTKTMQDAAWNYCHHKQLILDGTFGICNSKVLLFIAMGVDKENRGVPVAFFLFSAPTENKQTSSGYDTAILAKLIGKWRDSLGSRNHSTFEPFVAITDTDTRERGALQQVWPSIWEILCKFHLRQCWRNHRNAFLRGKDASLARVKARLRELEQALVDTRIYHDAIQLISDEERVLKGSHGAKDPALVGASAHIAYLRATWMPEPLWRSWSQFGREAAATAIGCHVKEILTTTNHLEAFNRTLKRRHIANAQRPGSRLRLDVLVMVLVKRIIPSFFAERAHRAGARNIRAQQLMSLPGGFEILAREQREQETRTVLGPVAYLTRDEDRDSRAAAMVQHGQISTPTLAGDGSTLLFECFSSLALPNESSPTIYTVTLFPPSDASCTCTDFKTRGGACKHIRGALIKLAQLRERSDTLAKLPRVQLPETELDARRLISEAISAAYGTEIEETAAQALATIHDLLRMDDNALFSATSFEDTNIADISATGESDEFDDSESVATDASQDDDDEQQGSTATALVS